MKLLIDGNDNYKFTEIYRLKQIRLKSILNILDKTYSTKEIYDLMKKDFDVCYKTIQRDLQTLKKKNLVIINLVNNRESNGLSSRITRVL